jgi:hypothetical protein
MNIGVVKAPDKILHLSFSSPLTLNSEHWGCEGTRQDFASDPAVKWESAVKGSFSPAGSGYSHVLLESSRRLL